MGIERNGVVVLAELRASQYVNEHVAVLLAYPKKLITPGKRFSADKP